MGARSVRGLAGASLCLAMGLGLSGCASIGAISGAVAGASTGAATANPLAGYATAVAVNAAVSTAQKRIARARDHKEQTRVAEAAGPLGPGQTASWNVKYIIPFFANHHGTVRVLRTIDTPLAQCRQILFTLQTGHAPHVHQTPYTTDICRDPQGWRWALAEPAVGRWQYFQHIE
ncbi:MAG: hypothetical protein PHI71_13755 [Acidiphilium sp.]|nr:hypothetical protein [Acidiphilium sp.]